MDKGVQGYLGSLDVRVWLDTSIAETRSVTLSPIWKPSLSCNSLFQLTLGGNLPAILSSGRVRLWPKVTRCACSDDDWLLSPSSTSSSGSDSLSEMLNIAAIVTSGEGGFNIKMRNVIFGFDNNYAVKKITI